MRVAITANRDVTRNDLAVFDRSMRDLCEMRPEEIIFGGARGGDTVSLEFAGFYREAGTRLVVIVPGVVAEQPREAENVIRLWADEVVEMRQRLSAEAFKARNFAMVDRARIDPNPFTLGFWNGDKRSGTYSCLAYASRVWCPLWVEAIEGSDK